VWRERRRQRIQQLEDAVAEAKASQAELMRRLELFETIAATAGVELDERQNVSDVPEPLVAAARDPRQDAPVRLDMAGREFIAVVGGEGGDPREWWTAIQRLAAQHSGASVIHLQRVILPAGLRAVAYRDARGNLVIYVSETLDAACQRAAVAEAMRAARRTRWRAALPSAIAIMLGARAIAARSFGVVKLRPLAWGATATTAALGATAAGVFITAAPHHHAPTASAPRPQPSASAPATRQAQGHQGDIKPVAASRRSPSSGHAASTGKPSPAASTGSSSPGPSPTPSPTEPSPSPSPSLVCVILLGQRVCVP
jgi:hypothetical protein